MAAAAPAVRVKKRIIICCDGTWMDSDSSPQVPSNVTRICRALKQEGFDKTTQKPIPQIIYYNAGVGTEDSSYSKYVGGGTGAGLAEHVREAYSFLCNNYSDGDEIFVIGFSRGAFTARTISSLVATIGLLTKHKGLSWLPQIFDDFENQPKGSGKYLEFPWPGRPPISSKDYRDKLDEMHLTRPDIKIKAVAVWDTVGALGIPMIALFPQPASKEFSFVDTKVAPNIEYAYHALALDERRRSYRPTVWEKPDNQDWPVELKQTWFPGVHSDVGGSYTNTDLANITLAWMISQLDPLLDFDHDYVVTLNKQSMARHKEKGEAIPEWGMGKIHDSMTAFFKVGGKAIRTPSEYFRTELKDLKPYAIQLLQYWLNINPSNTGIPLQNTNEHVHSSVRIRMSLKGKVSSDPNSETYDFEPALKGWTMRGVEVAPSQLSVPGQAGAMKNVSWEKTVKRPNKTGQMEEMTLVMKEDEFGDLERTLMEQWPNISKQFESLRPGDHKTDVRTHHEQRSDD